ncbi:hypothetical protein NPIL_545091 [Nephila pilipes]|uniref:Uncharacterized protein n=1 Tax=Nephila pilipes TaxID=299642 RepID=A0A8X6ULM7_NEPPI|nr:hypothetical protein NPIL_545091 [Nephila pilipes]
MQLRECFRNSIRVQQVTPTAIDSTPAVSENGGTPSVGWVCRLDPALSADQSGSRPTENFLCQTVFTNHRSRLMKGLRWQNPVNAFLKSLSLEMSSTSWPTEVLSNRTEMGRK